MPYEVSAPLPCRPCCPHLASLGRSSPVTSVRTSFISTLAIPNPPALALRGRYVMTLSLCLGNVDSLPHAPLFEFTVPPQSHVPRYLSIPRSGWLWPGRVQRIRTPATSADKSVRSAHIIYLAFSATLVLQYSRHAWTSRPRTTLSSLGPRHLSAHVQCPLLLYPASPTPRCTW